MTDTATYTLRRTWPEATDRHNDYVIRCNGADVTMTPAGDRWHWTIYITAEVHRVEGVPIEGQALSLDEAKKQFRTAFERMATQ